MPTKRKPRRDSDKCLIINRTVSFNIEDPFQAQLLKVVDDWTNFSGGVKRLIAASLSEVRPKFNGPIVEEFAPPEHVEEPVPAAVAEWDPMELF